MRAIRLEPVFLDQLPLNFFNLMAWNDIGFPGADPLIKPCLDLGGPAEFLDKPASCYQLRFSAVDLFQELRRGIRAVLRVAEQEARHVVVDENAHVRCPTTCLIPGGRTPCSWAAD